MPDFFKIEISNSDALKKAFAEFSKESEKYLSQAGQESAKLILETSGLRKYPPATAANAPGRTKQVTFGNGRVATFRMGYYVRGRGMFSPTRGGGYNFTGSSERFGTQWYILKIPGGVQIGNRASYAPFLAGDNQAGAMGQIGWRKLTEVAGEKLPEVTRIYEAWVDKLLVKIGLA